MIRVYPRKSKDEKALTNYNILNNNQLMSNEPQKTIKYIFKEHQTLLIAVNDT